jgi:glycosyltransferase involved in cell wall biosynthesis
MKVNIINHSDSFGGASRAAYRIHKSLLNIDVESTMIVNIKNTDEWSIRGPEKKIKQLTLPIWSALSTLIAKKFQKSLNKNLHSISIFNSNIINDINSSNVDLVNLHWINGEMLSISDISKINKPIVWTFHDMWPFCGSEHYTDSNRWIEGYYKDNRPNGDSGIDIDKWVWKRKFRNWTTPFHIVTPSNWLANCVRKSKLMSHFPITVIHNPIDINFWKPINKETARNILNLPLSKKYLLFGGIKGSKDIRKGIDLLINAIFKLKNNNIFDLEILIYGESTPKIQDDIGFPVTYFGHLHDDISLRLLYSVSDVMIIPSRQDNLPNTGVESLACGTPVVSFNIGGMSDIVNHLKTGYLAIPFNTDDLANGISWVLKNNTDGVLSYNSRIYAEQNFSYEVVSKQYFDVYKKVTNI